MTFKDHFSRHAMNYAAARPHYPAALVEFIVGQCSRHALAWDCATGNGQAAAALSPYFDKLFATDASQQQLDEAPVISNVEYRCVAAEDFDTEPGSLDLVTVAQALHWFDTQKFFQRVDSLLADGGLLAVWCYELTSVTPDVDAVVRHLYDDIVGVYWPPERHLVESAYRNIEFPYTPIPAPAMYMQCEWTCEQLQDYLLSWSATRRYMADLHRNPLDLIEDELKSSWGDAEVRSVRWPLHIRLSRK